ncbi:MAG: M48 family metallopeptidase [Oscillospiraceae bacterium]|nr:M48 family metallopeptidase [Oscillospiraceae bacterium]
MDFTLIRSRRKTIAIQVKSGPEVVVRAPMRMAKRDIGKFVEKHRGWIEKQLAAVIAHGLKNPEPTDAQIAELKARAKAEIPPRVDVFAKIMGLCPSGVKITSARTRFGSCSAKNSLCFSWRLMMYPQEAVDYVIVHELAHIVHKNHGRDFYRTIEQALPDYVWRRSLLKR